MEYTKGEEYSTKFHVSQVCTLETLDTNSPNHCITLHKQVSTVFHYFLDGVYLTGGTPLVEQVEHLGVVGTLGPLAAGWGASVEMIGSVGFPTLLSLSLVAGGVTPHWCNRQH